MIHLGSSSWYEGNKPGSITGHCGSSYPVRLDLGKDIMYKLEEHCKEISSICMRGRKYKELSMIPEIRNWTTLPIEKRFKHILSSEMIGYTKDDNEFHWL